MNKEELGDGKIHTAHIRERTVPEAYWSAIKAVSETHKLRTQYDRKDFQGDYIDPPGNDGRILIEVDEPFAQPRFPKLSWCERGKYIAEVLGVKDHLVI